MNSLALEIIKLTKINLEIKKISFPMGNGYSIAYFNKPYMFIVNIIVYHTHTQTMDPTNVC